MIEMRTAELDGKRIAYTSETEFYVQVGRGAKGSYRTRYSFKGNLVQAVGYFRAINVGNGYKARLIAPSMNRPVLARKVAQ